MDTTKLKPRLCHVVMRPDFQGYGFSLHTETEIGGLIAKEIEDGSPAEAAGMRDGDHFVEVNGVNVENRSYHDVINAIKEGGGEVKLLMVDDETEAYYKEQNKEINGDLPEVVYIKIPDRDEQRPPQDEVETEIITDVTLKPRLCHLTKWPGHPVWGFNFSNRRGHPSNFMGKIIDGTPADATMVKEGDRIIEVNGINVERTEHSDIVNLMKAGGDEVKILLVDPDTDELYQKHGEALNSNLPEVVYIKTPQRT